MMKRYYCFAGLEFQIEIPEACAYTQEWNLASFRVDSVKDPHRFFCSYAESLTEPEGPPYVTQPNFSLCTTSEGHIRYIGSPDAYVRAEHRGKLHVVQVKKNPFADKISIKTVLESMEIEHLMARNHGFVFHCSYIDHSGKAILFTAPSGTGKSTQADLWAKYRGAEIINGDRAAVRLADGQLLAEGIPFAGSSEYCKNRSLPIEAIVYLSQAPMTTIRRLRGYQAFSKIWEGVSVCTWDKTDMENVSAVVQKIVERVPVFHLSCTPDESAIMALEDALRKQEIL